MRACASRQPFPTSDRAGTAAVGLREFRRAVRMRQRSRFPDPVRNRAGQGRLPRLDHTADRPSPIGKATMPPLDAAMLVLAGITLFAAFVNGAIGYGFSS